IKGGDPPRIGSAAAASGHAEPLGVDLRAGLQVVESADAVPGFDAGGGVTPLVPPPHPLAVGAVVQSFDLAQLQRVDDQTDVAVPGKPDAVMLIRRLVAIADPVLFDAAMSADIQDGRGG